MLQTLSNFRTRFFPGVVAANSKGKPVQALVVAANSKGKPVQALIEAPIRSAEDDIPEMVAHFFATATFEQIWAFFKYSTVQFGDEVDIVMDQYAERTCRIALRTAIALRDEHGYPIFHPAVTALWVSDWNGFFDLYSLKYQFSDPEIVTELKNMQRYGSSDLLRNESVRWAGRLQIWHIDLFQRYPGLSKIEWLHAVCTEDERGMAFLLAQKRQKIESALASEIRPLVEGLQKCRGFLHQGRSLGFRVDLSEKLAQYLMLYYPEEARDVVGNIVSGISHSLISSTESP